MRRPDGFERPLETPAEADAEQQGRSVAAEAREVIRLDALRRRREEAQRSAPAPEGAEPRRWALSAYADLDDEPEAAEPSLPAEPGAEPDAEGPRPSRRGSNAQRVDRAWRSAQREQRRLDRAEAADTRREAKAARRARTRAERAEVRRFTAARRRQLRLALMTAGGLALALLLLVGLVWSPLMAVREVRVEGTDRLDAAVVQEALADQVGEPIATVTEAGVAERLQAIPQIESFQLDVVPPSTVIVRLVERRPVAIIETDGSASVIDAAGVVLGQVDDTTASLPRLDGVELGTEQFEAVATVLVSVPTEVLEATDTIAASTPSDIRLSLASGQTVQWGGAEQSPLKADVVAALMATQDPAAAAVLDVRAPEHPVVRGAETPGT
ncbi:FtsQ-type POTRA domain-containing protein [Agrococcus baldri]|uniref:POTRA domain-containing protein n=1 Tax=Agrococcus baldri TaxID=153730 RepID=A0AA87RKD2_9MICO|nr:FtsQ-type POTRA domain-containing protein [Agrococcus baldri]GEK80793.1 hypothetical protein ABA31_21440 [Agrococcus baldri]